MVRSRVGCQSGKVVYNSPMLACLLVHPDVSKREEKAEEILLENSISRNHPDLLWFGAEEKLGIEKAREIKDFLSLKPYQGSARAVVLVAAEDLTDAAQNALLKTLEEPPINTTLILGVASEDQLLPTILSRCKVINLTNPTIKTEGSFDKDIKKLLESSMDKRFQFIEKLDKREQFLTALTAFFRQQLLANAAGGNQVPPPGWNLKQIQTFLQDLLEAEKWARQNVNIRAILEYLMLKMPPGKIE